MVVRCYFAGCLYTQVVIVIVVFKNNVVAVVATVVPLLLDHLVQARHHDKGRGRL